MLPDTIKSRVEIQLGSAIKNIKPVGGGSINDAASFETSERKYFIKWNSTSQFPGMFEAEEKGLHILRECSGFVVPNVFFRSEADDISYLLMEFIERAPVYWRDAGLILANMHSYNRWKNDSFGLDHDNFIGSLKQSNRVHDSWSSFFTNERILPQMKLAIETRRLNSDDLIAADNFCKRIDEIFPKEKPCLLHGDLWSGNFMFTVEGPALFDPAVYWGHREMDIAMTRLFGGFDTQFYESYSEIFPLEKNWEERTQYCNLYPLLVHVNLFGGGYVQDVRTILNHFT